MLCAAAGPGDERGAAEGHVDRGLHSTGEPATADQGDALQTGRAVG